MDKKMIEKAFMRLNEYMDDYAIAELASVIVESKEAIMIECEVEHEVVGERHGQLWTKVSWRGRTVWANGGGHGVPGKALAIVLPLEKEDD